MEDAGQKISEVEDDNSLTLTLVKAWSPVSNKKLSQVDKKLCASRARMNFWRTHSEGPQRDRWRPTYGVWDNRHVTMRSCLTVPVVNQQHQITSRVPVQFALNAVPTSQNQISWQGKMSIAATWRRNRAEIRQVCLLSHIGIIKKAKKLIM